MRYAVILAGGAGQRLWPLSRETRPKQLLRLVSGKSLLEMAVERLEGLFDMEHILVVTNAEYADQVAAALPALPRENLIGEPMGRDTSNAIALAVELLAARSPDATMAVFTADHVIRPKDVFQQCVRAAIDAAEANDDALLTFGIRPTWPHSGLGYIHFGQKLSDGVHRVLGFKEKPDHTTARRYVESGDYYWNSGMFIWKLGAIRAAMNEFLPDSMRKLAPVGQAVAAGQDLRALLADIYPQLQKISIDYAVMEKAHKVLVVELKCEWLDVGSWPALEDVLEADEADNVVVAENVALLDSFRNIVVSENGHLLAVLGIDDCIVVHSGDATLVCNKSDSQRIKELVGYLERKFGKKFL
ncbi:MAG TPA: mannose-1-phosphate guanylyltransferase [Phycisphaerales bacterium]|nr:mannose-1-phosphate guanylyltransferase [Phycisphaerales bacterium]